jgi:hypothetical protein
MKLAPNRKAWSMILSLVAGPMLMAGCGAEESAPTSAPPSPLPNAGPSRPAPPPPQANKEGTGTASQVEKDLRKDLASPVIKPDTAIPPPAGTEKKP